MTVDQNQSTPLVRLATPEDFAEVARLTVAAYAESGQLSSEHGYEKVLADVAGRAAHSEILVAEDDGVLLGAVAFVLPGSQFAEISRDGEAEFRTLAVDPAAQRRGVARALVRACVRRAGELGAGALVICVRDFNTVAWDMYLKLGFTPLPERDWSPVPGVDLLALRLVILQ